MFFLAVLFWLLAVVAHASEPLPAVVDFATYRSASGAFVLEVDPTDLYGLKGSRCRLLSNGKEVWAKALPFTFHQAVVTDEGRVAGFGDEGPELVLVGENNGAVHVGILNETGELLLDDQLPRKYGFPGLAIPYVRGTLYQPAKGLFTVRLQDREREFWQTYDLKSGQRVDRVDIKEPENAGSSWILEARVLADLPLILVHWQTTPQPGQHGAVFALVDRQGKQVWQETLPTAYSIPGDETEEKKLQWMVKDKGAILEVSRAGVFDLWDAKEGKRVRFKVAAKDGAWRVEQTSVEPHAGPPEKEKAPFPAVQLSKLGDFVLSDAPKPNLFHQISAWALRMREEGAIRPLNADREAGAVLEGDIQSAGVDAIGRLHAYESTAKAIHVFDREGRKIRVSRMLPEDPSFSSITVGGDGSFLLENDTTEDRLCFDAEGRRIGIRPLLGLDFSEAWYARGSANDLLVLGFQGAFLADDTGKVLRRVDRQADRKWLGYPDSAAVASDKSFAILSMKDWGGPENITFFSAAGDPEKTAPLPEGYWKMLGLNRTHAIMEGETDYFLFTRADGTIQRFTPPQSDEGWTAFVAAAGRELWLFESASRKVTRYALPEGK